MDGQVIVGADEGVWNGGHGRQAGEEPVHIPVVFAVLLQDAKGPVQRQLRIGQGCGIGGPALIKAVAVFLIPHETDPLCPSGDEPFYQAEGGGVVFHGNEITLHQGLAGPGISVYKGAGDA